uniref:Uncharacterized protein n=1 Tax=Glossina pallidipes TaxID=7398 RepID=A0A1A9ZQE0_GLOPL
MTSEEVSTNSLLIDEPVVNADSGILIGGNCSIKRRQILKVTPPTTVTNDERLQYRCNFVRVCSYGVNGNAVKLVLVGYCYYDSAHYLIVIIIMIIKRINGKKI